MPGCRRRRSCGAKPSSPHRDVNEARVLSLTNFPLKVDYRFYRAARERNKRKIWLLKWHSQNTAELETTRRNARTAFREFLDVDHNPEGIVWALLREIEHRSKNCDPTNSRHASPYAITWKVDDPNLCPYNDASTKCTTRVHAGCPGFTMRTFGR